MRTRYSFWTVLLLLTASFVNASPLISADQQVAKNDTPNAKKNPNPNTSSIPSPQSPAVSKAVRKPSSAPLQGKPSASNQKSVGQSKRPEATKDDQWDAAVKKGKVLLDSLDAAHKKPSDKNTIDKYDQ